MNTDNNNIFEFLKAKFDGVKDFVLDHLKIVLPVAVAVLAVIVLVIALAANSRKKAIEEAQVAVDVQEETTQTDSGIVAVPEVPLEEDANPAVNELIAKYYDAMAEGDVDAVKSMNNNIDDTETIRIQETAKYIDKYESVKVYTKVGPVEGSYLAYVYSEVKFSDYDTTVPGMQAYYICTDENGNLYFNDGEESGSVINYIREVSLQDDVVELNNKSAVAYNDMLAEDESLSTFLVDLTESIDTSVGESLAEAEGDVQPSETEEAEAEVKEEEATATAETVITVKTTTTVNVRSSDSETADKLGKATEGQEFTLIEAKGNGWSEIDFNGKNAFIKSEFLETASTETLITVPEADNSGDSTETTTEDASNTATDGTVTVKENVRIRASASEDGEKIATAYMGEKLDFVQKMANGWTKIKYKGQIAYVKSDYVE